MASWGKEWIKFILSAQPTTSRTCWICVRAVNIITERQTLTISIWHTVAWQQDQTKQQRRVKRWITWRAWLRGNYFESIRYFRRMSRSWPFWSKSTVVRSALRSGSASGCHRGRYSCFGTRTSAAASRGCALKRSSSRWPALRRSSSGAFVSSQLWVLSPR